MAKPTSPKITDTRDARASSVVPVVDQAVRPLDGGDVLELHALITTGRLVGDLLAFFEGLEPAARYPAVVHE
jgi:hypothetical protein